MIKFPPSFQVSLEDWGSLETSSLSCLWSDFDIPCKLQVCQVSSCLIIGSYKRGQGRQCLPSLDILLSTCMSIIRATCRTFTLLSRDGILVLVNWYMGFFNHLTAEPFTIFSRNSVCLKAKNLLFLTHGYSGTRESIWGGTRVLKSWTLSSSTTSVCSIVHSPGVWFHDHNMTCISVNTFDFISS